MHHRPNLLCGYDSMGNCRGIQLLLIPEEISCDGINDFFLLPTKFQGVIKNVQFVDLGANAFSIPCVTLYDPLGSGFFDAYAKLGGLGTSLTRCYDSDPLLRPGILLPSPLLSAFAPAMLLAVPTVALGSISPAERSGMSVSIMSACTGFKITAKRVGANVINISVSAGLFQAATELDATPISVAVKGVTWERVGRKITLSKVKPKLGGMDAKLLLKHIQVWLIAQLNIWDHTWTGFLTFTPDGKNWWIGHGWGSLALLHIKKRQLGTVSYANGNTNVLQADCSPIDLRDGTDTKIPGNLNYYAFVYDTNKGIKRWITIKLCG